MLPCYKGQERGSTPEGGQVSAGRSLSPLPISHQNKERRNKTRQQNELQMQTKLRGVKLACPGA